MKPSEHNISVPDSVQSVNVCMLCGHVGDDVTRHYWYIGGQGNTIQIICDDVDACRKRSENGN